MNLRKRLVPWLAVLGLLACGPVATADILSLTHQNSTVLIDNASQSGVWSWNVDGIEHLTTQWLWYRIGAAGPETSLDAIPTVSYSPAAPTNAVTLTYTEASFTIDVIYTLVGGAAGSGISSLTETIRVRDAAQPLDLHLFQYSDFDLNGVNTGQSASISANAVTQTGGGGSLTETLDRDASHYEAAFYDSMLQSLLDGGPTTWNDSGSAGPGDVTWGFQWDAVIAPGETFEIGKQMDLTATVPEPSSLAILGGSLLLLIGAIRRRAKAA